MAPRHDEAAGHLLRDGVRRALRLRARRARRHTPRHPRARVAERAAGAARRRDLRRDETVVRLLPRALRDPLPLRGVPPGLRAGVQRRRDGEPGLRHLPRPVPLPRLGHPRRAADARQHGQPRDVAHVVRRPRDDEVVGRPLAQRVVRGVHVAPLPRRGDGVCRRLGRLLDRAQGVGLRRRAVALDPPGRRRRGPRRAERPAELRRHLLCQGSSRPAPAHRTRGRRPLHGGCARLSHREVLCQRHARRLPRRHRDRERRRPRHLVEGVAADGRSRHPAGESRRAGRSGRDGDRGSRDPRRPTGRPAAHLRRGGLDRRPRGVTRDDHRHGGGHARSTPWAARRSRQCSCPMRAT